jgi:hypothetical protein
MCLLPFKTYHFFLFRCILFCLITFTFQGCSSNNRDKFLSSEKCCTQYISDRKEFLDSLFQNIFEPDSIKTEIFFEQLELENNDHETVLIWRSFPKKEFSYQENSYVHLLDKKNNWSIPNPIRKYDPINGRLPKFEVTLRYKPDSICSTLTEQWLFVSQHLYQDPLDKFFTDGEIPYREEYVIFQYYIKSNELFSFYSRKDLDEEMFDLFGLNSIQETNDTNITKANQYGVLKFNMLMDWINIYLQHYNCK